MEPLAPDPLRRSLLWCVLQALLRIAATLMFDMKVWGRRNVPATGGVLLATNHQSFIDPVLVGVMLYRPVSYLARSTLFANKYFGWLIRSLHAFPVRRGEGDVGAIKETIRRLKEGHALNIFPEGSRSEDSEIGPIKSGIALVIRRAGVPVVPVAIDGSFDAWPKGSKFPRPHPVRMMYGKPMDLSGMESNEIAATLDRELRQMQARLRAYRQKEKTGAVAHGFTRI